MGIKFLGSGSTGVSPAASSIGTRELAINWADGKLFTSTNGTDVIQVTSDRGVAFKATTTYTAGDIVSSGGDLWLAVLPVQGTAPGTAGQWTKFSNTTNVTYDSLIIYDEGDIVVGPDDELYVAPVGGVPIAGTTPPAAPWTAVSSKDIGGRAYDIIAATAGSIVYELGDVVTEGGVAYFKTTGAAEATPGTFDPTEWTEIGTPEVGGVLWNGTVLDYTAGDIVVELTGVVGEEQQYICVADVLAGVGLQPSLDLLNANWIEYDTYTNTTLVPKAIGDIAQGEDFDKISHDDLFTKILYPYILPIISTFTTSTNIVEMGTTLGSDTFTWTNGPDIYGRGNIDLAINYVLRDVTAGADIANNVSLLAGDNIAHNTGVQKTSGIPQATNVFRITGTNTRAATFFKELTVYWKWRLFWGKSTSTPANYADLVALTNGGSKLTTTENGSHALTAGAFEDQYLAYPEDWGTATTIKVGGFEWARTMSVVSINNGSATTNYNIYKSDNATSAAMTLVVA